MKRLIKLTLVLLGITAPQGLYAQELSLEQCRQLARQNNLSQRSRNLELDIAQTRRKEAFTSYFPSVSATALHFRTAKPMIDTQLALPIPMPGLQPISISLLDKGTLASVSAMQPLFLGGRVVHGNRLAKLGEEVAKLSILKSERELDSETDKYYYQLLTLQAQREQLASLDTLLKRVSRDVDVAIKAGMTTENDRLRVQIREDELGSARLKLEHGISVLSLLLSHHLGISPEQVQIARTDVGTLPSPLEGYIDAEEAVARRVELGLLNKQVEAKELEHKMERGKLLPSVGLGASYSYSEMLKSNNNATIYAAVSVPISAWWGGSHAMRRKRIEREQARFSYDDARAKMRIEIQKAYMEVEEAYKQMHLSERSLSHAQRNMKDMELAHRSGTKSLSELLEAQSLLSEALTKQSQSRIDYLHKRSHYQRLTQ